MFFSMLKTLKPSRANQLNTHNRWRAALWHPLFLLLLLLLLLSKKNPATKNRNKQKAQNFKGSESHWNVESELEELSLLFRLFLQPHNNNNPAPKKNRVEAFPSSSSSSSSFVSPLNPFLFLNPTLVLQQQPQHLMIFRTTTTTTTTNANQSDLLPPQRDGISDFVEVLD